MNRITQEEINRLRAPFPLAAHSVREGNRTKDGTKIRWFIWVDKPAVEERLNDVFPGEWASSQPVLYPMGNSVAATISITIRGVSRGNTGEDSNGQEKAKGATTDAFRRAAADWGLAKYVWEMDLQIWTESYPDKDWDTQAKREKEALKKFADWYQKKFANYKPSNILPVPPETHQEAATSDLPQAVGDFEGQPVETPQSRLAGNGAPSNGDKKRIPPTKNTAPGWKSELGTVKNAVLKFYNHPKHLEASIALLEKEGRLTDDMPASLAIATIENHKDAALPPF